MLWMGKRLKSKLCIKSVSISRRQQNPPQSLQLRVRKDGAHEHLRYAATAMLWHDENIRNIGYGSKICNNSCKADLLPAEEHAKA